MKQAARQKAEAALKRGPDWLIEEQNGTGSWGEFPHPAIAALCGMALHQAPGVDAAKSKAAVDKALAYVLRFKQGDGSIYPAVAHQEDAKVSGNYPNYSTSIALLFLNTVNRPEDLETMIKARKYLKGSQIQDQTRADFGGVGYGRQGTADLSNLSWAADALHATDYLDKEPYTKDPEAAKQTKAMWASVATFLTKCQSLQETNPNERLSDDGGFIYGTDKSEAGEVEVNGKKRLLSYGTMTYAGLMSMLYAHLTRDDVRVKGAMRFLMDNYTLAENPGIGKSGHFYYLHVMTKALNAYGVDKLTDAKGQPHDWRQEVVEQLLSMQDAKGGYWINPDGRWMESMPELATPYAMLTLKATLGLNHTQPDRD